MENAELPCGGPEKTLVFITTNNTGANHPAVRWIAPVAVIYQLNGDWAFPDGAVVVEHTLLITVNDSFDMGEAFSTYAAPGTFGLTVTLAANDIVTLIAQADTDSGTSLAVDFYVTGPLNPQDAQTTGEFGRSAPVGIQDARPRARR